MYVDCLTCLICRSQEAVVGVSWMDEVELGCGVAAVNEQSGSYLNCCSAVHRAQLNLVFQFGDTYYARV